MIKDRIKNIKDKIKNDDKPKIDNNYIINRFENNYDYDYDYDYEYELNRKKMQNNRSF